MASLDERRLAVRALRQQATALLRLVPVAEPVPVVEVPAAEPVVPAPKRQIKNMKPRIRTFEHDFTVTPAELADAQAARPRTRGDCASGPRPCPWVGCRQHLFLDVSPKGAILVNHETSDPMEMTDTCALDLADRGGRTLEEVGAVMHVTRERVRQIETDALWAWRQEARRRGLEVYADAFDGSDEDVYPDNGGDE
ncbi:MAG: hypothetical protein IV100_15895 [Myxococcales bacterium]|nr:hypothetical protein [Myxococcales bacterium]